MSLLQRSSIKYDRQRLAGLDYDRLVEFDQHAVALRRHGGGGLPNRLTAEDHLLQAGRRGEADFAYDELALDDVNLVSLLAAALGLQERAPTFRPGEERLEMLGVIRGVKRSDLAVPSYS